MEEDIYFAGLFDGEGCVSINKTKGTKDKPYSRPGFQLRISITNTNIEVLNKLQNTYGGNIYKRERKNARTYYDWVAASNQCLEPLKRWIPFLIIKKKQAEIAVSFQENRKTNKTDEEWNKEFSSYEDIRKLNARYGTEYYDINS